MRFSTKLLVKLALVLTAIPILMLSYNFYTSLDDSATKTPLVSNKSINRITKTSKIGLNLFKNVEDRFEDMYNFNAGLKSFMRKKTKKVKLPKHEIEVWGKASIAEYLWCHILDANATTYANGLLKHGEITLQNLHIRFRSGPGIIQNTVPITVKNLILVLNGKDDLKIKFSKSWLDYLVHFKHLKNVALLVLGDEKCDNNWILPYLKSHGGVVDIVFVIYDSKLVDNREFFQWPLGVATYRGFPNFKSNHINIKSDRQYLCNFLGTVYKNSSREVLRKILKKSNKCFVAARDTWVPSETYESMERYLKVLTDSDLTLNPAGQNTECYRIYEALSLGSVPIVEDVLTPGQCDSENNSPLRLLKEHKAPLIYIRNWNELQDILETESKLSLEVKVERRKRIVKWYESFKVKMKNRFLDIIKRNFFKEES